MDIAGLGKRVQIYIDEADTVRGRSLYLAILEMLRAEGAAGATVTRGIAGFGSHSRIHTTRLVDVVSPLPLVITWIDAPDRVERLLPTICGMVREGLVTVEEVQVAKYTHRDLPALRPTLTVGEVMTRDVTSVRIDTPVAAVVDALIGRDFRAVPVVNANDHLVGIITNSDLVDRGGLSARLELLATMDAGDRQAVVAAAGANTAQDVMTRLPVIIRPSASLEQAVQLMLTEGHKRLPVIDEQRRVVGMISRADVLRSLGEGFPIPDNGEQPATAMPTVVGDVMTRNVPVVRESARIAEVLDAVVSTRLNRAVVIDEQGRVKGVVSDADLLERLNPRLRSGVLGALMRRGRLVPDEAARTTAAELMTAPALTVTPDTPIGPAARRMVEARRKVLPIVDADGLLLGIVDRAHLLGAVQEPREDR